MANVKSAYIRTATKACTLRAADRTTLVFIGRPHPRDGDTRTNRRSSSIVRRPDETVYDRVYKTVINHLAVPGFFFLNNNNMTRRNKNAFLYENASAYRSSTDHSGTTTIIRYAFGTFRRRARTTRRVTDRGLEIGQDPKPEPGSKTGAEIRNSRFYRVKRFWEQVAFDFTDTSNHFFFFKYHVCLDSLKITVYFNTGKNDGKF